MTNERSMKVHKKSVRSIELTPDGQSIITVSKDKSIKLRSIETGKMITKYKRAHEYFILFSRFSVLIKCFFQFF